MEKKPFKKYRIIALMASLETLMVCLTMMVIMYFVLVKDRLALTAIGVCEQAILLVITLVTALSYAMAIVIPRLIATKEEEKARLYFKQVLKVTTLLALFLTFLLWFFAENILLLLKVESDLLKKATLFFRINILVLCVTSLRIVILMYLKTRFLIKQVLFINFLGCSLYIMLTWLFLKNNVDSIIAVGIAYVISQVSSFLVALVFVRDDLRETKKAKQDIKELVKMAFWPFVELIIIRIGLILLIFFVHQLSNLLITVHVILNLIIGFSFSIISGFAVMLQMAIGQIDSTKENDAVWKFWKVSLLLTLVISIFSYVLIIVFSRYLLPLLIGDIKLRQLTMNHLWYVGLLLFPQNFQWVTTNMIRGLKGLKYIVVSSFLTSVILRSMLLVIAWLLYPRMLIWYWVAVIIDQTVRFFINIGYMTKKRQHQKTLASNKDYSNCDLYSEA